LDRIIFRVKKFLKEDSGTVATEYVLLVALIAIGIISGIRILGEAINALFSNSTDQINAT
jgi:Flp pilus assembly pilin Flp